MLEIKTSADKGSWLDGNGEVSVIPETYMLQASLYAHLSNLDRILFAVGFLEDADYDRPRQWVPTSGNVALLAIDGLDMGENMAYCKEWYDNHIKAGCTPGWTDRGADVVKYLKAYKPVAGRKKQGINATAMFHKASALLESRRLWHISAISTTSSAVSIERLRFLAERYLYSTMYGCSSSR